MRSYISLKYLPLSLRGTKQPRSYTGRVAKFEICKAEMHSDEVASYLAMTKFVLKLLLT